MKPILFLCFIAALLFAQPSFAQTKDKKDKQTASAAKTTKTKTTTTSATGMKKDGTPDMRYKKNKETVETKTTPATTNTPATTTTTSVSKTTAVQKSSPAPINNPPVSRSTPMQGQNKSADKVVATDSKGRTIYEGPRGGHYYINANGHKEYVKQ